MTPTLVYLAALVFGFGCGFAVGWVVCEYRDRSG